MNTVMRLYRKITEMLVYCFNIESIRPLTEREIVTLSLILADGLISDTVSLSPIFRGDRVTEVGPRKNFATPWSSNMVSVCRAAGLDCVTRVERSRIYLVPDGSDLQDFIVANYDRMTECHYPEPLISFETGVIPEAVYEIDMKSKGPDALLDVPGIAMDEWDRQFYYDYFVKRHGRNPTIVELMDLNNANSEHSRHGFFKGIQVIDGKQQSKTLFELVMDTMNANPKGSLVAFKDNSSVVEGYPIRTIYPTYPGKPSPFELVEVEYNPLLTAETHNFPTGVAPFPGAETGTGGRIRDVQGTGKGGFVVAGTAGYCVGSLFIPGYDLPWEIRYPAPDNLATPLTIEVQASNGASDYGNKFGEPLIQGFTRSFDIHLAKERWAYLKPIMFTGGIGQIDRRLIKKEQPLKGMKIVQVGGPAYRVGFGGGAASSMLQGENDKKLDFDAVQRGDAEMEQKMNRVIRACNEMGNKTLIEVIHDQGAGGPANVLKELVEESGGWIEIRLINVGDPTMSVLEIYVAEYQERNGFLIKPENLEMFQAICDREKVNCEVLGEVTGDLRFVVRDSKDGSTPVDIELDELLGNIPQKTFTDERVDPKLSPLILPEDLTVRDALWDVFRLISVGSKRFLTNKVDRAVTGLIAQQQCCGPLQLTVADVAVVAQSHFGLTGIATAIGEQAVKMLIDPAAGGRMAVGESLTNLVWAGGIKLDETKCSANWMWAPRLPGEGVAIYDAAKGMRDAMIGIGIAVDGGKDSLSMATKVPMPDGSVETVKSPRELVISAYAAMPDIRKVVTPDIKSTVSHLLFIDLSGGKNRLGGSALAQVNGQIGNESPDMDDPGLVKKSFLAIQELIGEDLILAGHDRSDGGLIATLLEMAFAGNCGIEVSMGGNCSALESLFSEELGLVIECSPGNTSRIGGLLNERSIPWAKIGNTIPEKRITIKHNNKVVLNESMELLRQWWEETSYQLERQQMNPDCAEEEKRNIFSRKGPRCFIPFDVTTMPEVDDEDKPKVAILRDEGSNSDREMTSAFFTAGFEPWDITMTDLLEERVDLSMFRGLAAVGGFSYADVPSSAKGWAATILFNERLKKMFEEFYNRKDTFTLGVCNGCQLFGLLGWVPFQGIDPERQPRFIRNISNRFESRWSTVRIKKSPSILLEGMEGLVFGIHVDHGEGRLHFPDVELRDQVIAEGWAPIVFVDDDGNATEKYPFNPNGSQGGLAGLCSPDGRHLAMMPHPERAFLPWQCHHLPRSIRHLSMSPWFKMFQNAYDWCVGK